MMLVENHLYCLNDWRYINKFVSTMVFLIINEETFFILIIYYPEINSWAPGKATPYHLILIEWIDILCKISVFLIFL